MSLSEVLECIMLEPIDKAFAKYFLKEDESPACTAFLSYLLAAARSGHLCAQVGDIFLPSPSEIWPEAEISESMLKSGFETLPSRLISNTTATPLYLDGPFCYLQKNWILETECLRFFHQLLEAKPEKTIDVNFVDSYLSKAALTAAQAKVIKAGCLGCLTIISGGPGTGKTYTAGHLITLLSGLSDLEIVLAAPTGKAAARLQKSIPHFLQAKTLHSLLSVQKTRETEELVLSADVVLVDECSMIDLKMMVRLLGSLKKGARLILLGDPCQLPPVEMGNIFADFVSYLTHSAPDRFSMLTESLRVEDNQLIALAHLVNQGECQAALHLIHNIESDNVNELTDLLDTKWSALEAQMEDDASAMRLFEKFRVLCPLRSGPFGVDSLNLLLDQRRKYRPSRYIPIILNRHAKTFDLFNGDTGVLVKGKEGEDYALFEKGSELLKIPAYLLPSYELAYCLSVHKCQGSEYEEVLIVLPNGAHVFGRQALYTAITRARKRLVFWGQPGVFVKMAECQNPRRSGFERRLKIIRN